MPFPEAVTFREPVPQHDSRNGKNNPAKDDVNASWIGHDFLRLARKSVYDDHVSPVAILHSASQVYNRRYRIKVDSVAGLRNPNRRL